MALFPHAWVFPGGHLEIGESLEYGALRELEEEAGIAIKMSTKKEESKDSDPDEDISSQYSYKG